MISGFRNDSMASVCGGCLALQDAGVPIKSTIVGIAMGLVMDTEEFGGDGTPLILSDITGAEDASGDMDFKVNLLGLFFVAPFSCFLEVLLKKLMMRTPPLFMNNFQVAGNEDGVTAFQMDIKVYLHLVTLC